MTKSIINVFEYAFATGSALLGALVTLSFGKEDHNINPAAEMNLWAFLAVACFFLIPALVLPVGAYIQIGMHRNALGRVLMGLASLFLIITFLIFTFTIGYAGIYLVPQRFFLVLFSMLTVITSFLGRR